MITWLKRASNSHGTTTSKRLIKSLAKSTEANGLKIDKFGKVSVKSNSQMDPSTKVWSKIRHSMVQEE